mgnify:CR=1 FL=1
MMCSTFVARRRPRPAGPLLVALAIGLWLAAIPAVAQQAAAPVLAPK